MPPKFRIVIDGYHAQAGHAHARRSALTAATANAIRTAVLRIAHGLGAPHFDAADIVSSFHGGCPAPGMPRGLAVITEDYTRAVLTGVRAAARLQPMEISLTPLVLTTAGYRQPASVDKDIQACINAAAPGDWLAVLTPDRHHAPAIEAAVARGVEVVVVVCDDARQFYSKKLAAAVHSGRAYKLKFSSVISLEPLEPVAA
jgi:hypothetical protein